MEKITGILKLQTILRLSQGSVHGYELLKHLGKHYSKKKASPSQVYPFLGVLKKQGFLSVSKGNRGRKIYSLTSKGKKFVKKILEEYDSVLDAYVKNVVHQCSHCSCQIYRGGVVRSVRGMKKVFCCEHCAKH
ncbi:PadR family transcriptional regulator [Candidatus Woesearchaeota archaeon]|nr:PadR family transcriptional regulator [Candidatus Woesearchaeota archaeon]